MGFIGDSSVSKSNQESNQQSTNTNIDTTNETTNTNVTDNSMEMSSNVNSNTQVDSSQAINTMQTIDQSSIQNIAPSTDNYSVDNSQTINATIQNTSNKLIQSCGMSIEQANAAVNIVKDESANTNIDASNTFTNTGAGATITDIMKSKLNQAIDFNADIDKSCVLDALNDLQTDLKSINNSNQKSMGEHGKDSVLCPICAENIPSSSAVCPICAEPLAIAPPAAPAETAHHQPQIHHPDNPIDFTGENTMAEVLEELKKINKNLSLIAKHLLFD